MSERKKAQKTGKICNKSFKKVRGVHIYYLTKKIQIFFDKIITFSYCAKTYCCSIGIQGNENNNYILCKRTNMHISVYMNFVI